MSRIDMQAVCDLLRAGDIPAYVEQTGGGCATIFAGGQQWIDDDAGWRYPAIAGPGWFEGPNWTHPYGDTADFSIGRDDDGESPAVSIAGDATAEDVAREIATLISKT